MISLGKAEFTIHEAAFPGSDFNQARAADSRLAVAQCFVADRARPLHGRLRIGGNNAARKSAHCPIARKAAVAAIAIAKTKRFMWEK